MATATHKFALSLGKKDRNAYKELGKTTLWTIRWLLRKPGEPDFNGSWSLPSNFRNNVAERALQKKSKKSKVLKSEASINWEIN